uniref:CSON009617 protein n=1 Tax=Culicoides sonorensis TaxID=179676 RepID=A0A336N2Q0_CULSO
MMSSQQEVGVRDFVLLDEVSMPKFMGNLKKRFIIFAMTKNDMVNPPLHDARGMTPIIRMVVFCANAGQYFNEGEMKCQANRHRPTYFESV